MTLRVSGKNMDVGDALRTKAEGHFDTVVKKYFDGGYTGHLTLEPEGSGFNALCMVHLDSGAVLQATAYGGDAISAYEILSETIEKRLRRYNRRLKSHRRHPNGEDTLEAQSYVLAPPDESDEWEEDYSPPVIAETRVDIPTATVSDAVMLLDLRNTNALMFKNSATGAFNMVYRRHDGTIGWVEPQRGSL